MENLKLKFLIIFLLAGLFSTAQVQFGNNIYAVNNAGANGNIKRNLDGLKVYDSAINAKLAAGLSITNFPSSFNIGNFPATQPVSLLSLPAFAAIPAFKIDHTTPGTTDAVQVSNFPSSFSVSNFPSSFNVGNFPATQAVSAAALPLPTNAATESGNLAAIKTDVDKIPAQGQALAGASMPVVLPTTQITALTPPAAITNYANETGGNLASLNTKTPALGQATKANSQPVVTASDEIVSIVTGQSAQTALVNNILTTTSGTAGTDVSQYRSFAVQINSTGTAGNYIFEGSVDNVNYLPIPVYDMSSASPNVSISAFAVTAVNRIIVGACQWPYLRLRIQTVITGGSIQAFAAYSRNNLSSTVQVVGNLTAGNLNANVGTVGAVTALSQFNAVATPSDGTSGPSTTSIRTWNSFFNGASWDRAHGNWNTTTGDAGGKVASFNGATQTNWDSRGATIFILCTTVSGTTPTMTAQLQWSPDGSGTNWINLGPASTSITTTGNTIAINVYPTNFSLAGATPAALTTGATTTVQINAPLPRTWRIVYTITGTTPSFAITAAYVNYQL